MAFLWIKVLHIVAVVAWMAGLFYLPRLFVYHSSETVGSRPDELFKIMERRLMKAIMRPALVVALIAGALTVQWGGFGWSAAWLWLKLIGVVALVGYHGLLETHLTRFQRGERPRNARYFRFINEIPTLLLIWIVIFVVVKPFS